MGDLLEQYQAVAAIKDPKQKRQATSDLVLALIQAVEELQQQQPKPGRRRG